MSAYERLDPAVQAIVDRNAEAASKRTGMALEEAREDIARRVVVKRGTAVHGTGH